MIDAEAVYAVWLREFKVYLREKERVISSFVSPILWLIVFGSGLGASVSLHGVSYQVFIYPGVLSMALLFTSVFYGIYIIWDRKLDFLKEVLVAPVSRSSIFVGKMLGGCTDAMMQSLILLVLGVLIGIPLTPATFIYSLLILFLTSVAMVSLGLVLGSNLTNQEAFNLVINFVIWPLFFFSGALFDVTTLPPWLSTITYLNPLTYGVDLLRGAILNVQVFPTYLDFSVLIVFSLVMMWLGTVSFGRMQQSK
ncbi:MAG: ABC-type multidrug transport system, permease component [Candidatus Fermentimicrarchaeum limneticum]|uniref:ABC-type multidrug transport system, permease component n=1 Tax=Fermentimicrarchaeum limneticum TaxID=2795018 RepID=A0A7D5XJM8_FERL1|nr:MAG: ABC-type multidrug transport system, permease component [Candidatus Fermentimicrarchaeum limneticum]